MKVYNTESRIKEKITVSEKRPLRIYTCGPTVYDYAHIGNFRTYVFEDIFRRVLLYNGFSLIQVMNLTDVDDKTIKGSIKNHRSLKVYTEKYKKAFFEDIQTLSIEKAEFYPEATAYISEMIRMIQGLLDKNYAYEGADGSIYFSIRRFPSYGKLSHLKLDELQKNAQNRISSDEYEKENASDFVLWKKYDPLRDGEVFWDSPFGKGRPGWHIECSAMALAVLGETVDIHCGGVDNIFPHHENEIAQSEAYTEKPFVRYWVHSEFLLVDGKKMSKSLKNFYTLRDLLKLGYCGDEIRYLLMQTHYRTQCNFTLKGLEAAKSSLSRIKEFVQRVFGIEQEKEYLPLEELIGETKNSFDQSLADDLNMPAALASLFEFIRKVNTFIDQDLLGKKDKEKIFLLLSEMNKILAVLPLEKEKEKISADVKIALEKREQARREKNWKLADELRNFIESQGYQVEDTPHGSKVKRA